MCFEKLTLRLYESRLVVFLALGVETWKPGLFDFNSNELHGAVGSLKRSKTYIILSFQIHSSAYPLTVFRR